MFGKAWITYGRPSGAFIELGRQRVDDVYDEAEARERFRAIPRFKKCAILRVELVDTFALRQRDWVREECDEEV